MIHHFAKPRKLFEEFTLYFPVEVENQQNIMSSFKQAKRKAVPLKIALQGVSFSGKTMSGIKLAHGLANGKPVAVIDTENESAALYDHLDFLHATIKPPFKSDKYVALIREAVDAGVGCIVIDSLSHGWQYILDYKDQLDTAGGRGAQWSNWAKAKPLWSTLKDAILQSPVHVVVTFREKADYAIETSDDGRNKKSDVKKLGTKAVAEEGTEYEFTVVWKLDKDTHLARVEKDRTGLFDGRTFVIDEGTGRELLQWMGEGEFEAGAEWNLLKESDPTEFARAAEESERMRKDQARTITNQRHMKGTVVKALLDAAKERGEDGSQLIIDADRYGATDADRIIRYVCQKLGLDPVELCREQQTATQSPAAPKPPAAPKEAAKDEKKPETKEPEKKNIVGGSAEGGMNGQEVRYFYGTDPNFEKFMEISGTMGWPTEPPGAIAVACELGGIGAVASFGDIPKARWVKIAEAAEAVKLGDAPEPKAVKK